MNWMSFLYGAITAIVVCVLASTIMCLYAVKHPQIIARNIMKMQTSTFRKLAARQ